MRGRTFAKRTTQIRDGDLQIAFVNADMGPGGLEQVFFRYELTLFVSKCQKNIHCAASEVHLLSPEQQLAMSREQSERTKIHNLVRFNWRHGRHITPSQMYRISITNGKAEEEKRS